MHGCVGVGAGRYVGAERWSDVHCCSCGGGRGGGTARWGEGVAGEGKVQVVVAALLLRRLLRLLMLLRLGLLCLLPSLPLLLTCTLSPLTILQLLGEGNMALMAFSGLLGTAKHTQLRDIDRVVSATACVCISRGGGTGAGL
jgi:hypothetical protein